MTMSSMHRALLSSAPLRRSHILAVGIGAVCILAGSRIALSQCERVRLEAPDGAEDDRLGNDIRVDGDRMVVGAHLDDHSGLVDAGAAYVFVRSGNSWLYEAKLIASHPQNDARFGWSVDIDADLIVVGARNENQFGPESGAAYVFRRSGSRWVQEARLGAGDPEEFARFGHSVSISGDAVLVGAPKENFLRGAAYVFRREGMAWAQEAKLGAQFGGSGGDELGYSVCIDGDVAFLGAWQVEDLNQPFNHGSVFVHRRINGVWTFEQQLNSADRAQAENFGMALDVQGDRAIISKWHDSTRGTNAGSAYIFEHDGQQWVERQKLLAFDAGPEHEFGVDVGLDGDTVVIGARGNTELGFNAGAAYLFTLISNVWTFSGKLLASDGGPDMLFGNSVDVSGNVAAIGAPRRNAGRGSAYVYQIDNCNPILTVSATCPNGGPIQVGWSNATPNNQVAILFAYGQGAFRIPQGRPCAGVQLGLSANGIMLVQNTTFGSGANGSRTLFSNASSNACGGFLQLLDIATCRTSNVERIE